MYKIEWRESALADLKNIGFTISEKIWKRVNNYLAQDPVNLGKPLVGAYKGLYRYRAFGDWRVIYQIRKSELQIVIVEVGHRRKVYD